MTRPDITVAQATKSLGQYARHLSATRVSTTDSILVVNLAGFGTPSYREEACSAVEKASDTLGGIPAYAVLTWCRTDEGLYRRIASYCRTLLHEILPKDAEFTCYGKTYGLLISIQTPISMEDAKYIADRLEPVCIDTVGSDVSVRYFITSPEGYAMRELGVEHPTKCFGVGHQAAPHRADRPVVTAVHAKRKTDTISGDDLADFCIALHTAPRSMDALELITLLDNVGGTGS
jgi:hypothetical protein